MRILCLHGMGQSATILEALTAGLRHAMPGHYSYTFIDGEKECDAGPGIGGMFPGPYWSYHLRFSTDSIAEQHEYIQEIIDEEGPFDGLLAFSQGAALAASMILHRQIEHPFEPPLFRFAIFIGGTRPLSRNPEIGYDVTSYYGHIDLKEYLAQQNLQEASQEGQDATASDGSNDSASDRSISRSCSDSSSATDISDGEEVCKAFYTHSVAERIQIPTVHVCGAKDGFLAQGIQLFEMCESSLREKFDHDGGHEVPMKPEITSKIADVINKAVMRSQTVGC